MELLYQLVTKKYIKRNLITRMEKQIEGFNYLITDEGQVISKQNIISI